MATVASTTLSFGFVSTPVALKTVKENTSVSFELASPAGHTVKQVYVDELTGEVVGPRSECLRGIFTDDGFVAVEADTIKAIDESCKIEGIVIDGFVPRDTVPFERAEGCYYLAPGKVAKSVAPNAVKSLALLRDGLRETGNVGIGKLTLRTKQRPFIVYEEDGALLVSTLAFADSFAAQEEASEVLASVQTDPANLGLFKQLVEAQAVDPSKLNEYADEATPLKIELVEKALAGEKIVAPQKIEKSEPEGDLASLLAESIAAATPTAKKAA